MEKLTVVTLISLTVVLLSGTVSSQNLREELTKILTRRMNENHQQIRPEPNTADVIGKRSDADATKEEDMQKRSDSGAPAKKPKDVKRQESDGSAPEQRRELDARMDNLLKRLLQFEKINNHVKRETVEERVKEILWLKWDLENVNNTDNLRDDLGFKDLDLVELILEVEKEFSIAIPDEEASGWNIVLDVIDTANRGA